MRNSPSPSDLHPYNHPQGAVDLVAHLWLCCGHHFQGEELPDLLDTPPQWRKEALTSRSRLTVE